MIPGFVDLQVNGYKGVDFSGPNLTLKDIDLVSNQLLAQGTIGYCPTVISSPLEIYERNLPLIAEAMESKQRARILGIHLEGPFLNPKYGPRGIHPENQIISPSIKLFEQFRTWSKDKITLFTLAPEREGALDLIKHIVNKSKVVVSIGHLDAGYKTIQEAIDAGARAATHVGNGLADMIDRHNNPLWPILADDRLSGLFITDGSHLPKEMVRVCLRAKGISNFIVTSDMVHLAGLEPGEYMFHGVPVILEGKNYLHRKGATQHAGSASTMLECMNFLASLRELDEKGLYTVGYENPLKLIDGKIDNLRLKFAPTLKYNGETFSIRR